MLTFEDIILGKLYRDKESNFTGIAVMKSYGLNYIHPIVKLHGAVSLEKIPSIHAIPVYDVWLSDLEEVETE